MKKLLTLFTAGLTFNAFATTIQTTGPSQAALDINHLECHCEKHQVMFDVKDGDQVQEMVKHCLINENKKDSTVKFVDEHSNKTVKCKVNDGKLVLKSCQAFTPNKDNYTHMSAKDMANMHMSNASAAK